MALRLRLATDLPCNEPDESAARMGWKRGLVKRGPEIPEEAKPTSTKRRPPEGHGRRSAESLGTYEGSTDPVMANVCRLLIFTLAPEFRLLKAKVIGYGKLSPPMLMVALYVVPLPVWAASTRKY